MNGFSEFGDECLQDVALYRQALDACHLHDAAGAAGDRKGYFPGSDVAARGRYADDAVAFANEAGYFTVLNDIDAAAVGCAGVSPRNGVVTGCARAGLHQAAIDWKAGIRRHVHSGNQTRYSRRRHQFGIYAQMTHGVAATGEVIKLRRGVGKVQAPALGKHHIVVEVVREAFP